MVTEWCQSGVRVVSGEDQQGAIVHIYHTAACRMVSVVLPWCYRGVKVLLQWCQSGVTEVLHMLTSDHGGKSTHHLRGELLVQHDRHL
jgi:hypothetical protein